ncbi:MAG: hypothetical protein PHD15_07435, partial [Clostridia bacterium]|nr:hypothetical protein [Clostridia bacterium]
MTQAAVVKFQEKYASVALTPLGLTKGTGFVGAGTRTQLNTLLTSGTTTTPVSNLPAGCTSTTGFSSLTGVSCSTVSTLPTGCTSTTGFSPVTGQSCAGGTTTPVVTPVTGSGMSVALASDSPSNTTLVTGQSAAPLAKFVITNSDSVTATITKVELSRIGVSADSTLANVYLFNGETRLTDAATVNQGVVSFNSGSGLFTIAAGQSMVVTVASDIASSTSGQIVGVSLTGITSNVEVKSTLPLQAATQTIAAATLADYTFVTTTGTANIDPADDVVVWQSTVTAGTRDIKVSKLALKQISSIDSDDVENFRLFVNGTEVAQVASLDANNMVTFTFDYTLTGTKTFKVLADIKGGSSRTLQMSLRNKADFTAIDSQYNVAVSGTTIPATYKALTIQSGSVTVKKATTSTTGYLSLNASNQLLAKYTLEAYGENVKIDTLTLKATLANGSTNTKILPAGLRNGRILINGTQYGSTASLLAAGTAYTVNYVAVPGEAVTIEVYADVYGSDTSSTVVLETTDTIQVSIETGSGNATRQTSLTSVNVPGSQVLANSLTVSSGAVTAAAQSTYGAQSVVFPQKDYKIASYVVTGSSVENVNLFDLELAVTATDANQKTAVRNVYVVIDGVTDTAIKTNAADTGTATPAAVTYNFSINKELAKNATTVVEFYADVDTTGTPDAAATVATTLVASGTGANSGATLSNSAATGQTSTYKAPVIAITKGASSPATAIIADEGTLSVVSYVLEAQNDSYILDKFVVDFAGTNAATVISSVALKDGSTTLATQPGSAEVTFAGLNYTIPANTKKTLDVVVTLSAVGAGAGSTGANIIADIDHTKTYLAPASTGVVAAYGADVTAGNNIYVYKTIPTISLVSLPSTTLSAGTKTLQKFTVSADASGDLAWGQIVFDIAKTTGTTIGCITGAGNCVVTLFDGTNNVAGTFTSDLADAADTAGTITFVPTTEEVIPAGSSKTYELKATVGGTVISGNYVISKIVKKTSSNSASAAKATLLSSDNFVWSDVSALGHSTTTTDWAGDFLVKNLTTDSQTLSGTGS